MSFRIIIIILMIFIFIPPASTSAELDDYHFKIIQIAFMNGYSNAIDSDIDTIELLKKNKNYLKIHMELAVGEYMQKVIALNQKPLSDHVSDSNQGSSFKPDRSF